MVWRPLGKPLSVCEKLYGGMVLRWSNVLNRRPSTKYCHVLVRCAAVSFHLSATVLPTLVTGHDRQLSSRMRNEPPPLHSSEPFGASTLCGSHLIAPQSNDVR